ncbi:hypothetical protein K435DRAFT_774981 [Dendrothele bispora CBS 962.96]|uniref:Uncharacterized protein n=1 Tax=Dendrothele bispora (strain CBS 962.96) TaxID=1314807 RepID=A0A4S8MKQ4_DENBC|nr:hypothetical protein K435DRAFT_774981 [Dendrothele bispora CBS 962.96]
MSPPQAPGATQPAPTTSGTSKNGVVSSKKPPVPPPTKSSPQNVQQKRRSGKPIINWFQRKLAGTVRAKRVENAPQVNGKGRGSQLVVRSPNRVVSSPLPSPVPNTNRQQGKLDNIRRKTISLNGDDDVRDASILSEDDERSIDDSVARDSMWSPNSALEADEDASLRPLPPSSPPSPSPSRSSSSYLSDPRTFKSIAASTKPTTLLSIDLNGGMAHIAQAPITPTSQAARSPHVRNSSTASNTPNLLGSGTSITFAALPPSPQSSSRPDSLREPAGSAQPSNGIVQAPLHTTHHPRNNPRPSSPPLDNASVLTLASSAYAIPGLRVGSVTPVWSSAPPSAVGGGGDSVSHFGGTYEDVESTSQLALGDDDRLDDRDADASVRALRPRSTRRGSWESEASRWSARIQIGTGTPSLARDRSLWTTNSIRTGALSADNVDTYDKSEEPDVTENDTSGDASTTEAEAVGSSVPPESVRTDETTSVSPHATNVTEKTVDSHAECASQKDDTERPPLERVSSADTVAQSPKSDQESKPDQLGTLQEQPHTANDGSEVQTDDKDESDKNHPKPT